MPRKSDNHRKIYEQHYGRIGKDANGRSLEVHHIDGNHSNNDISNLKLVTIQEHYDLHYAQGDWAACALMSARAKISPEEVSRLSREAQLERVRAGTHHLLGPTNNNNRIKKGNHPFLDGEAAKQRNLKRVKAGNHNLLKRTDGSSQSGDRVKDGSHHFVNNNPTHNKLKAGTHPFQVNHQNKIQVTCLCCKKTGGLVNMQRYHLNNCKATKILPGPTN